METILSRSILHSSCHTPHLSVLMRLFYNLYVLRWCLRSTVLISSQDASSWVTAKRSWTLPHFLVFWICCKRRKTLSVAWDTLFTTHVSLWSKLGSGFVGIFPGPSRTRRQIIKGTSKPRFSAFEWWQYFLFGLVNRLELSGKWFLFPDVSMGAAQEWTRVS